jgi:hypothetical protein
MEDATFSGNLFIQLSEEKAHLIVCLAALPWVRVRISLPSRFRSGTDGSGDNSMNCHGFINCPNAPNAQATNRLLLSTASLLDLVLDKLDLDNCRLIFSSSFFH